MKSMIALCLGLAQREGGDEGKLPGNFQFRPARRRQYGSAASSRALDSGAARQQCAGAAFNSRPLSVASRLRRRRLSSPSLPGQRRGEQLCAGQRRGEAAACWRHLSTRGLRPSPLVSVAAWTVARRAAVRWTAARRASCVRRLSTRDARPSPLVSVAAWTAARRAAVRWTALAPPSTRGLRPSPLDSSPSGQRSARRLCAGLTSRLGTPVRRLSSPSPPVRRHGEAAVRWRRLSTRNARPSPLVSVAAWPAARRGSSAPAPPLDSRPPSFASRLIAVWTVARRGSYALDSDAARRLCASAAPRLETPVRRLLSLLPPVQQRGEQLCAGQRRG